MYFLLYLCVAIVCASHFAEAHMICRAMHLAVCRWSLGEKNFRNRKQSNFQVSSVSLMEYEHKSSITYKQSSCQNALFPHYLLTSLSLGLQISKWSWVINDHYLLTRCPANLIVIHEGIQLKISNFSASVTGPVPGAFREKCVLPVKIREDFLFSAGKDETFEVRLFSTY